MIRRDGTRTIFEMAYPFEKLAALRGEVGSKFRLADWIFDIDAPPDNPALGRLRGLALFPFVSHVDRNALFWGDYTMTE